ncbi:MAG: hypothetical protein K6U11_09590 [bacterium]|nr:hypothetical protein [bacterium]
MLVFLSDVHLTDGSSGTTIDPRAFRKFCQSLKNIVGDARQSNIKKIEIVLLGDIFDLIRSDFWLRPENEGLSQPVRPWSAPNITDRSGWNLQAYTEAIVDKIITHPRNIEIAGYLEELRTECLGEDVEVQLSYLIGNHDWLINRYPSARQRIADFLGMSDSKFYTENRFPYERIFEGYWCLARHGDCYDRINYEGERDGSSLGDAIVIDLLTRFPEEVKNDPTLGRDADLVNKLKEIDNVRPLFDIPAWIQSICNLRPGIERKVHEIWNSLVDQFFKIPFVKKHDRFGPDVIDCLEMAMRLSSGFSFTKLKEILSSRALRFLVQQTENFRKFAYQEAALRNNEVRYVVYGHTHTSAQVPLDIAAIPPHTSVERIYFNTGTWRKVFEAASFGGGKCAFIGWHVMTFVVFYREEEKERARNYEVWSASLGYGQ